MAMPTYNITIFVDGKEEGKRRATNLNQASITLNEYTGGQNFTI